MYFPKSQIQTNLYTKGNELVATDSGENYIGYYFKTSDGSYYSGKTPSDEPVFGLSLAPNTQLYQSPNLINDLSNRTPNNINSSTPIVEYTLDPDYATISNTNYSDALITAPVNTKVFPNDNDYSLGQYTRYFLRKINNPIFKEITSETFNRYTKKDPKVQYTLYIPFNFTWTLVGKDRKTVANINYNILELTEKRFKVRGLTSYFKNKLTEYYKDSNIEETPEVGRSLGDNRGGY